MAFIYQSSHFVFHDSFKLAQRTSWTENEEEKCLFATDENKKPKKLGGEKLTFCWHLESHWRKKSRIRIRNVLVRICGSGTVSKRHGFGALVQGMPTIHWNIKHCTARLSSTKCTSTALRHSTSQSTHLTWHATCAYSRTMYKSLKS